MFCPAIRDNSFDWRTFEGFGVGWRVAAFDSLRWPGEKLQIPPRHAGTGRLRWDDKGEGGGSLGGWRLAWRVAARLEGGLCWDGGLCWEGLQGSQDAAGVADGQDSGREIAGDYAASAYYGVLPYRDAGTHDGAAA